jgi:hypothetical protein
MPKNKNKKMRNRKNSLTSQEVKYLPPKSTGITIKKGIK